LWTRRMPGSILSIGRVLRRSLRGLGGRRGIMIWCEGGLAVLGGMNRRGRWRGGLGRWGMGFDGAAALLVYNF
jgi:hypothetical protein